MPTRPFPSFYLYLDNKGEYRWRYQYSGNHKIEADSGEGYDTYEACRAGIEMVKAGWDAPVWLSGDVTKRVKG